jgi:hypothetical protein
MSKSELKEDKNGNLVGCPMEPVINRVEQLGLLLNEIEEWCLVLNDAGVLVFKDVDVALENLNIAGCKQDWEAGKHLGDCTNFPSSCCACFWQRLVDQGSLLALSLTPGSYITIEQVVSEDEDDKNNPLWIEVASKFRAEVQRLGL